MQFVTKTKSGKINHDWGFESFEKLEAFYRLSTADEIEFTCFMQEGRDGDIRYVATTYFPEEPTHAELVQFEKSEEYSRAYISIQDNL